MKAAVTDCLAGEMLVQHVQHATHAPSVAHFASLVVKRTPWAAMDCKIGHGRNSGGSAEGVLHEGGKWAGGEGWGAGDWGWESECGARRGIGVQAWFVGAGGFRRTAKSCFVNQRGNLSS